MTVDVYWNRTRKLWSVRQGGKVIGYRSELGLRDCQLIVQKGGQSATRATGQRNVHAWARGELIENAHELAFALSGNAIEYHPRYTETFIHVANKGGGYAEVRKPIYEADWLLFYPDGSLCLGVAHITRAEITARFDAALGRTA